MVRPLACPLQELCDLLIGGPLGLATSRMAAGLFNIHSAVAAKSCPSARHIWLRLQTLRGRPLARADIRGATHNHASRLINGDHIKRNPQPTAVHSLSSPYTRSALSGHIKSFCFNLVDLMISTSVLQRLVPSFSPLSRLFETVNAQFGQAQSLQASAAWVQDQLSNLRKLANHSSNDFPSFEIVLSRVSPWLRCVCVSVWQSICVEFSWSWAFHQMWTVNRGCSFHKLFKWVRSWLFDCEVEDQRLGYWVLPESSWHGTTLSSCEAQLSRRYWRQHLVLSFLQLSRTANLVLPGLGVIVTEKCDFLRWERRRTQLVRTNFTVFEAAREGRLLFIRLRHLDHLLNGFHAARVCLPKATSVFAAPLGASGSVHSGNMHRVVHLHGRGRVQWHALQRTGWGHNLSICSPPVEHVDDFECPRHIRCGPTKLVDVLVSAAGAPEGQVALGESGFLQ